MQGIQSRAARPRRFEETAAEFHHFDGSSLPRIADRPHGAPDRGIALGLYPAAGVVTAVQGEPPERAIHLFEGAVQIAGAMFPASRLPGFRPGIGSTCGQRGRAARPHSAESRWMGHGTSGGISSPARNTGCRQADRFGLVPGDEREFIPLPG